MNKEKTGSVQNEKENRWRDTVSAVLLAGGKSTRMGSDKAALPFLGTTMLEYQVKRLKDLGIEDIMVSGKETDLPQVRYIRDVYPGKGPLAGMHACFMNAMHESCLVVAVDMPLIRMETLNFLLEAHREGNSRATVLVSQGHWQPLLAVYERDLFSEAEKLLQAGRGSVKALLEQVHCQFAEYRGEEACIMNCNTPEAYQKALLFTEEKNESDR